jgi:hypothetical protein
METLAIVLAILFVGGVIDLKGDTDSGFLPFAVVNASFLGALFIGLFVAVTA